MARVSHTVFGIIVEIVLAEHIPYGPSGLHDLAGLLQSSGIRGRWMFQLSNILANAVSMLFIKTPFVQIRLRWALSL